MTRIFDAPRNLSSMPTPGRAAQAWLGISRLVDAGLRVDLRVGGKYRWVWRNTDGREMGVGGSTARCAARATVNTEKFDDAWYP